jgi:parallel beta-helix repeat protein
MMRILSGMMLTLLFVGTCALASNVGTVQAQARPLDSFWVVPSALNFNPVNGSVGTLFNITVWAYMENGTYVWQDTVNFNATVFQEVASGYTDGATSQFFAGHGTLLIPPAVDNVAGRVLSGESLLGSDFQTETNASLNWIEFNVTATPTTATTPWTGIFDINATGTQGTYFLDTKWNTVNSASNLYDATYSLMYVLAVSVSPSSVVIDVDQSQLFSSNVAGGTSPYTYQWYLNDNAVAGATCPTWTFTPSWPSSNTVYVVVNDSATPCVSAQSNNASITAVSPTVYIMSDGSIVPPYAPISSPDEITYTFTGNMSYPGYNGIVVERNNIVINGAGYTVQGTDQSGNGLSLTDISNVIIENANIENFQNGIYLSSSNNDTIRGSNATANPEGIYLDNSSNNTVYGNNMTNDGAGVGLGELRSSSNNSVSGNSITDSGQGVYLYSSSNNTISKNNIANNWNVSSMEPQTWTSVWVANSSNNMVSENNITNKTWGVWLGYSSNNTVSENNITNNVNGIVLGYWIGPAGQTELWPSSNNSISGNNITANNYDGIDLYSSSSNIISGNTATSNGDYGIELDSSSKNIVNGNNATANSSGIYLINSSNNTVSGNNVTTNGADGIELKTSSNNTISGNDVMANNAVGIFLEASSNNTVYNNNFIGNQNAQASVDSASVGNVWDDGYPSGGNYWSDYNGTDLSSGPHQNVTGSDGIGDTPYVIDANNADHYPLIVPEFPEPLIIAMFMLTTLLAIAVYKKRHGSS